MKKSNQDPWWLPGPGAGMGRQLLFLVMIPVIAPIIVFHVLGKGLLRGKSLDEMSAGHR